MTQSGLAHFCRNLLDGMAKNCKGGKSSVHYRWICRLLQLIGALIIVAEIFAALWWFGAALPLGEAILRERADDLRLVSALLVPVPLVFGAWLIVRGHKLARRDFERGLTKAMESETSSPDPKRTFGPIGL